MTVRRGYGAGVVVAACLLASGLAACAPVVSRGGPGTLNPGLDEAPLSTKLDKKDLDYLVEQNLTALYSSTFWTGEVSGGGRPFVAIFPIRNETSQHVDDEMATLLSSIETSLVKWRHGPGDGGQGGPPAQCQVLHHRQARRSRRAPAKDATSPVLALRSGDRCRDEPHQIPARVDPQQGRERLSGASLSLM
jgi:hypothetical protein